MFARVLDTAKRILSRSPSVQGRSSELRDISPTDAPHPDNAMVTTRGGTETPGTTAATPRSSTKRRVAKRELEALETPTQAKRQKKSAPASTRKLVSVTPEPGSPVDEGEQEATQDSVETIHVVIPSTEVPVNEDDLPIRRRSSPQVVVAKTSPTAHTLTVYAEETIIKNAPLEDTVEGQAEHQDVMVDIENSEENALASQTNEKKDRTPPVKKSSQRKKKAQDQGTPEQQALQRASTPLKEVPSSSFESDQAAVTSQNDNTISLAAKKAHMRFDSEEPAEPGGTSTINAQSHRRYEIPETQQSESLEAREGNDDDESASDSDAEPETITTATAASKAQLAQQEAERAQRAQAAKEVARRQKREQRIAEEQAQKREREALKAKKLARKLAKQQKHDAVHGSRNDDKDEEGQAEDEEREEIGRRDAASLPALLPASLLDTIAPHRPPTPPLLQQRGQTAEARRKEKLNHHIKFLERSEKAPKDVKKGRLSVAVLGQHNPAMPPRANRDTRNVREHWLKGREVQKRKGAKARFRPVKVERRESGVRGFLRGEE